MGISLCYSSAGPVVDSAAAVVGRADDHHEALGLMGTVIETSTGVNPTPLPAQSADACPAVDAIWVRASQWTAGPAVSGSGLFQINQAVRVMVVATMSHGIPLGVSSALAFVTAAATRLGDYLPWIESVTGTGSTHPPARHGPP
ncbi:MAG TPA: hypothetical protein VGL46_09395 [Pseudonocardiaceae bacterium]|jgi:hypothetical protein